MDPNEMYELMVEASRQAIREELNSDDIQMSQRMFGGSVSIVDGEGRLVKEVEVLSLFKKVTSVREKLRVLEQKVNNHSTLSAPEKAELQTYITRSFGSLTTFNFMFQQEHDKFRGTGS
jgi:hypothetical protein